MLIALTLGAAVVVLLPVAEALGAEGAGSGRKIWDNVMLFVNSACLVALFIRYAKKPLMSFLRGERSKVEQNLGTVEEKMAQMQAAVTAERTKLQGFDQRIREIQAGILEMGRQEKESLTEQGRVAAEKMVEKARIYATHRIAKARKALAGEMVEAAVGMVEEKLIKALSEEDNEELIHQFLADLKSPRQAG